MGNGKEFTKVSSSVSTTEYTAFDILGRVTAAKQTTEGGDAAGYSTGYTYNLSGALVEETYPSGRKVKNVLDNDGELSLVQSARCGVVNGVTATCSDPQGYFSYAKSFTYNASGAVTSMQLGNGRWESTTFNSRLQPTQIALGTVQNATDKLKLDYTYGTTANNGNVLSQKITVPRSGQSDMVFDQTYTYDSLNRLKMAEEKTGTTTNWKQTFVFDRYGNRNFDRANTTQPASFANPNISDPSVDAANNRFTSGQGYTYDAAGNVITDAEGRTFTYDGENKQIEVRNSGSSTIGQYYFDGDGRRVKKYVPSTGETTVFVYDASGKLMAEYSTEQASSPTVNYTATDPLGSPRVITNKQGEVVSRRDFMPFGEEITPDASYRSAALKYGISDGVRQKFTGYQRDEETDLDFAEARYYYNDHGRFTAVDPLLASGKSANPQTFNRYAYTMNRPLILKDPKGLQAGGLLTKQETFAVAHPIVASQIGEFSKYGMNIASTATRFAVNSDFRTNIANEEITEINALRHTILSAIITARFGSDIAKEATDAHEKSPELPSSTQNGSTTFSNSDTADQEADLRNNAIGRDIGASMEGKSNKEIATAVLIHFKDQGLYVLKTEKDGSTTVIWTKIVQTQVDNTLKNWNNREDDGFTPKGRKDAVNEQLKGTDQVIDNTRGLHKVYE